MINELNYVTPASLDDAYSLLKAEHFWPLAGATDLIPQMRRMELPVETLVDISCLPELSSIRLNQTNLEIGALCTHGELVESKFLQENAVSLVEAAASIGCQQTRNRGTLGGNIANASPAADTIPPLLTFDAVVHLGSQQGKRTMRLSDLLTGPGKTAIEAGELIEWISFVPLKGHGLAFLKLGKRNGMSISIGSVAVAIALDKSGVISDARIAMGSVAPTAVRCNTAEAVLLGEIPCAELYDKAGEVLVDDISPIDDVRASANYRRITASALVKQALSIAEGRIQ